MQLFSYWIKFHDSMVDKILKIEISTTIFKFHFCHSAVSKTSNGVIWLLYSLFDKKKINKYNLPKNVRNIFLNLFSTGSLIEREYRQNQSHEGFEGPQLACGWKFPYNEKYKHFIGDQFNSPITNKEKRWRLVTPMNAKTNILTFAWMNVQLDLFTIHEHTRSELLKS